jgi:hypothetical protein
MKPKIGRPKTSPEKAKSVLVGAKFSPQELKQIEAAVEQSGEDKSKWLRKAAIEATKEWIKLDQWSPKELHGKTVEFEVVLILEGPIRGTGTFDVLQRGDGLVKIRIVSYDRSSTEYTRNEIRVYVPQHGVACIKRQPKGATCDFSLFDPLFQKCVRGAAWASRIESP